jgi:predicted regulator of amino acid metabolism with ACT domain
LTIEYKETILYSIGEIIMSKAFGAPEQAKIKQIISEGVTVMQEIADLTEGLNETIKAVAEELEVKPSVIRKAIRIAQKDQWDQVWREFDDLETIVDISGHANRRED